MKDISTYHLISELLAEGNGNIYPDLEPFDLQEIFVELSKRAKINIDSKESALDWCMGHGDISDEERDLIKTSARIYEIEKKAMGQLDDDPDDGVEA